jgi:hypothetical protein
MLDASNVRTARRIRSRASRPLRGMRGRLDERLDRP